MTKNDVRLLELLSCCNQTIENGIFLKLINCLYFLYRKSINMVYNITKEVLPNTLKGEI